MPGPLPHLPAPRHQGVCSHCRHSTPPPQRCNNARHHTSVLVLVVLVLTASLLPHTVPHPPPYSVDRLRGPSRLAHRAPCSALLAHICTIRPISTPPLVRHMLALHRPPQPPLAPLFLPPPTHTPHTSRAGSHVACCTWHPFRPCCQFLNASTVPPANAVTQPINHLCRTFLPVAAAAANSCCMLSVAA
jgi:hypothetical protein